MDAYRVALIVPLYQNEKFDTSLVEYLGFGYIASYLRSKGIIVDIIDAYVENLTCEDICEALEKYKYDMLAFTLMSSQYYENCKSILKQLAPVILEQTSIVVGGYYATFYPENILKDEENIQFVILGEGEKTFYELIEGLRSNKEPQEVKGLMYRKAGEIVFWGHRDLMTLEELNNLPNPSRDTLKHILSAAHSRREAQILSSRGCYGSCAFCAVNIFYSTQKGGKWRARSPESVVAEIEELIRDYKVDYIYFADEEFIGIGQKGQERARNIAKLIIAKGLRINFNIFCRVDSVDFETFKLLKQAGLDMVFLGVEFGTQKLLDFYNKGVKAEDNIKALQIIKALDIKMAVGYMMFEPLMDIQGFRENLKFFYEYMPFRLKYIIRKLAIYHNSSAYQKLYKQLDIDNYLSFNELAGDYYEYRFKDKRIAMLYSVLSGALPVIAPSKRYKKLMRQTDKPIQEKLLQEWSYGIYTFIDKIAEELAKEEDFSEANEQLYINKLKQSLIAWDEQA